MKQFLRGDKVKLVKFTDRYITAQYLDWMNNYEINKYLTVGRFPIAQENVIVPDDEKNLMFAIISKMGINSADRLWEDTDYNFYIGTASLHNIDWIARKGEVGYMIGDKSYWNAGMATETVELITDYAFSRLNLNKLTANVVEKNEGSIKALEKNGFKRFAINKEDYYSEGKLLSSYCFHNFKAWYNER